LCDPDEIPPDPTRIGFGGVTLDWNCDLFFDSLGLINDQGVLIDFLGYLPFTTHLPHLTIETYSPHEGKKR
jgi:hypothetical protein